jgi:hypothetical protein
MKARTFSWMLYAGLCGMGPKPQARYLPNHAFGFLQFLSRVQRIFRPPRSGVLLAPPPPISAGNGYSNLTGDNLRNMIPVTNSQAFSSQIDCNDWTKSAIPNHTSRRTKMLRRVQRILTSLGMAESLSFVSAGLQFLQPTTNHSLSRNGVTECRCVTTSAWQYSSQAMQKSRSTA